MEQPFAKIIEQMDMVAGLNHTWTPMKKLPTKHSNMVGISPEKAKINEEFMHRSNANMEMLVRQMRELTNDRSI